MLNVDKTDKPKRYEFSWEVLGYDCGPSKIRSPTFRVNFQVTEWYMELDISRLQNIISYIPFRLQRVPGIGPDSVTFNVNITVKLKGCCSTINKVSAMHKQFSGNENYLAFEIEFPPQKLDSKEDDFNWLTAKTLLITLEMIEHPEFTKNFWYNGTSLKAVVDSLKTLYSDAYAHDLVLKVSEKEMKLHKWILNRRWPKLASHLSINKSSREVETKEFSDIPYEILDPLLKYAYCGDLDFMYQLHDIDKDFKLFNFVDKFNYFRLNDQIAQLSPTCSSSQILQSYRSSFELQFTDVTSTEKPMGDFKTCHIPLKPRLPREPATGSKGHIRFMDLRIYVDKGPFGYNWLKFSVVLGKIPEENPVTMKCKLYVVGQNKAKYLLTEQDLVFDTDSEITFTTDFCKNKVSKRYHKISDPVITWRELIDERNNFMRIRSTTGQKGQVDVKKDIYFRFEVKMADGEFLHNTRHGESEWSFESDNKIFQDLRNIYNDEMFKDITLTAENYSIKAHKAILVARSRKLEKAIKANPNLKALPINIEPELLRVFTHYLYTGQLEEVPKDKIKRLFSVAKEYELECLKGILEEHQNKSKLQNGTSMICD